MTHTDSEINRSNNPPTALTIAGTDPSGGAGMHADLKTFTARKVFGTGIITALVAQNTHGVSRVYGIDTDFVEAQFESVFEDCEVHATKSGMLGTRALVELVISRHARYHFGFYTIDPVMVASSGDRLLDVDAVALVRSQLLPLADLLTPNLPEAALLLGEHVGEARSVAEMEAQARELVQRGAGAVLLKGGHATGEVVSDVLVASSGFSTVFTHPRIHSPHTHGTGCTLSAAITAEVAKWRHAKRMSVSEKLRDDALQEIVGKALGYLQRAILSAATWQLSLHPQDSRGPVNHQVDILV